MLLVRPIVIAPNHADMDMLAVDGMNEIRAPVRHDPHFHIRVLLQELLENGGRI